MRKFIIVVSLTVCCVAAPTSPPASNDQKEHNILLQRPSPINPDVPSDPKPDEKIIKITDPKEIVKHKREIEDGPYDHISRFAPTVQPARQIEEHHSQESDENHSAESDSTHHRQKRERGQIKDTTPAPPRKTVLKKDSPKQSRSLNAPTTAPLKNSLVSTPAPAHDLPNLRRRRQVDPHFIGATTVGVTPLIYRDEDKKPEHEITPSEEPLVSTAEPVTHEATSVKRDIPVPLVPTYHHPEESPKNGDNQEEKRDGVQSENTKNAEGNTEHAHQPKKHKRNEHSQNDDDSKSSESNESEEESKTPVAPLQNHQPIHRPVHPQLAQPHTFPIPAQLWHAGEQYDKPQVNIKPATEHDEPVAVRDKTPVGEQLAVHHQLEQQHQPYIFAQPPHTEEQNDKPEVNIKPAAEHDEPVAVHDNTFAGEQLAVHHQLAQQHQPHISTQPPHAEEQNDKPEVNIKAASEHGEPVAVHDNTPVGEQLAVHPELAQPYPSPISAQLAHAGEQNDKPQVNIKPAAEHDAAVAVHDNTHVGEQLAVQHQLAQQHQPQIPDEPAAKHDEPGVEQLVVQPQLARQYQSKISAQLSHTGELPAGHDNPIEDHNNTPALEQLARIKPTQIIAYEPPANENNIAIRHPVPVAELFSRPKH